MKLPGTTIEVSDTSVNIANEIWDKVFLSGGLVLSQVTAIAGVEPYEVQNWVRRGFLPPPARKKYDRNQLCRVITINMLRESMLIERITKLLEYINGKLDDTSDDLIDDAELYNYYVNLLVKLGGKIPSESLLSSSIQQIIQNYSGPTEDAPKRLSTVLEIMLYTHFSSDMRKHADQCFKEIVTENA